MRADLVYRLFIIALSGLRLNKKIVVLLTFAALTPAYQPVFEPIVQVFGPHAGAGIRPETT